MVLWRPKTLWCPYIYPLDEINTLLNPVLLDLFVCCVGSLRGGDGGKIDVEASSEKKTHNRLLLLHLLSSFWFLTFEIFFSFMSSLRRSHLKVQYLGKYTFSPLFCRELKMRKTPHSYLSVKYTEQSRLQQLLSSTQKLEAGLPYCPKLKENGLPAPLNLTT